MRTFHLKFSSNTTVYVQANSKYSYSLSALFELWESAFTSSHSSHSLPGRPTENTLVPSEFPLALQRLRKLYNDYFKIILVLHGLEEFMHWGGVSG